MVGASGARALLLRAEGTLDIGMPLFDTEDVRSAMPAAAEALKTGQPRPTFAFKGQ